MNNLFGFFLNYTPNMFNVGFGQHKTSVAFLSMGRGLLLELTHFFMKRMFSTRPAMLSQLQFFGGLGFVSLGDVVEVAANSAF